MLHLGNTVLLFQDEAIAKMHPTLTKCWSRIGERKEIGTVDNHHKRVIFGSVNPFTGKTTLSFGSSINQHWFLKHLDEVKRSYPGKNIIMCLDNCRSHFTKKVRSFLEKNKNFFFLFLPPYSPDLNLIERLWKLLRMRVTHNFLFKSLEELEKSIKEFFEYLSIDEVKKLCVI